MKEILIISGKGGTGKTILTASLALLADSRILVDCDVDAADLHLILKPDTKQKNIFMAGQIAIIKEDLCIQCGRCKELCRFDAIEYSEAGYIIRELACEGCAVCFEACPVSAIIMKDNQAGEWYVSETPYGEMVHARLNIAEGNSGKLVTLVRNEARKIAEQKDYQWIIIDGPPGIGCPVIASLSGVNFIIIITEPTVSGQHDLERVTELIKHFKIPAGVCINKYNINLSITAKIERFCNDNNLELLGKLPYDIIVTKAMVNGQSIMEYAPKHHISLKIRSLWKQVSNLK